MPIYNSGLGASFGVGVEATGAIGTWVAPTGWYEVTDESFQMVPKYLDSTSLKPGQAYQRGVRTNISEYDVNGDLSLECISRGTTTGTTAVGSYGMQFWWKYALGSDWTTGVVESGSAYRHVLTPGTKDLMSLSVECGRPSTTSTAAQRFGYSGCKVSKWDFSCTEGQLATLKMTFDGIRESTTGTIVSPVYAAATAQPGVFSFANASSFTIGTGAATTTGGTGTAATGQTTISGTSAITTVVKGITLSGDTPIASSRFGLGSAGFKRTQIQNGFPILSGTLDAEFTNKSEFYDLFTGNLAQSLQLDFTQYIQGVDAAGAPGGTGTNPFRLSFTLPYVKFKTGQVSLNGPDILTQKIGFQAYDDGANPPIQVKIVSSDSAL